VGDLIIAIDGPSGAGKGTVAREVASRLGYRHVDTGAMYRAVAWRARELGADLHDAAAVAAIARAAAFEPGERVVIDGQLRLTPGIQDSILGETGEKQPAENPAERNVQSSNSPQAAPATAQRGNESVARGG